MLLRTFGKLIHDLAHENEGVVSISDFRKWEKLSIKKRKAELDINFLKNCQQFGVFPKYLCFNIPHVNANDTRAVRKRLLRSALSKRIKEKVTIEKQLKRYADQVKSLVTSFDFHILTKSISQNIRQLETSFVNTHKKKLQNDLYAEESSILKYGHAYAIPPKFISKTKVFIL